jgi:hypothetical protein
MDQLKHKLEESDLIREPGKITIKGTEKDIFKETYIKPDFSLNLTLTSLKHEQFVNIPRENKDNPFEPILNEMYPPDGEQLRGQSLLDHAITPLHFPYATCFEVDIIICYKEKAETSNTGNSYLRRTTSFEGDGQWVYTITFEVNKNLYKELKNLVLENKIGKVDVQIDLTKQDKIFCHYSTGALVVDELNRSNVELITNRFYFSSKEESLDIRSGMSKLNIDRDVSKLWDRNMTQDEYISLRKNNLLGVDDKEENFFKEILNTLNIIKEDQGLKVELRRLSKVTIFILALVILGIILVFFN